MGIVLKLVSILHFKLNTVRDIVIDIVQGQNIDIYYSFDYFFLLTKKYLQSTLYNSTISKLIGRQKSLTKNKAKYILYISTIT